MAELAEIFATRVALDIAARVRQVLRPGEKPSDFLRQIIEDEVARREAELVEQEQAAERAAKLADISNWIAPARSSDRFGYG